MMKAGRYYVGDLCYVMHPQWDEFCSITIRGNEVLDGEFSLANGVKFATYGTAYGDGSYVDQEDREYGVDAGLIGCIRVDDINDPEAVKDGGNIIDFPYDFETSCENGVIRIGHIVINTDYEDDEDDYPDDDEG